MTSAINPTNIDQNYPIPGQDNNSQGFRNNFTATAQNFEYAAQEITDLQNRVVLKSALAGTTLDNDMNGSSLSNAQIKGFSSAVVALGTISGVVPINYSLGHYQTLTTSGPIAINFSGWPSTGSQAWITVEINVSNISHTLILPSAVSIGTQGVIGLDTTTNTLTFPSVGTYLLSFTTSNAGSQISLINANPALQPFNGGSQLIVSGGVASLALTTSYFNGPGSATLPVGVNGICKVFVQTTSGTGTIAVASAGWGGLGTITLAGVGKSCQLQFISGSWWCIGNNGATFS